MRSKKEQELYEQGLKTCSMCKRVREHAYFYRRAGGKYIDGRCKDCHRERFRASAMRRKYGVELEEVERMMEQQGGVCAICGGEEKREYPGGRVALLSVDHDHETGEVRGLLCSSCNTGLGQFQDDPSLMLAAAAYIVARQDILNVDHPHISFR